MTQLRHWPKKASAAVKLAPCELVDPWKVERRQLEAATALHRAELGQGSAGR